VVRCDGEAVRVGSSTATDSEQEEGADGVDARVAITKLERAVDLAGEQAGRRRSSSMRIDSTPAGGSAVEDVSLDDPLPFSPGDDRPEPKEPALVWVLMQAMDLPLGGLDYRAAVGGRGPAPTQVTQKSVLEDVLVLERTARKLRRFVAGISNRTVEIAPLPREPRPIDEATREKARRALAKSGFVRVTK
jgi:hypothetical protein